MKPPDLRRILVLGCPGGGKTTFALALRQRLRLPVVHLDQLYWNPDATNVSEAVFDARLAQALAQDRWIIDGNYSRTLPRRLARCDTAFFLDYPAEVCLSGVEARQGQPRADLPWRETGDDPEFLDFIRTFAAERRPEILVQLAAVPDKRICIFHSRAEADAWLAALAYS